MAIKRSQGAYFPCVVLSAGNMRERSQRKDLATVVRILEPGTPGVLSQTAAGMNVLGRRTETENGHGGTTLMQGDEVADDESQRIGLVRRYRTRAFPTDGRGRALVPGGTGLATSVQTSITTSHSAEVTRGFP